MSLTRSEFFVRMKRYAAGFQAHGVKPGDRVCVMLENSVEAYLAAFGLVFAGATLVLCYPWHIERKNYAVMTCLIPFEAGGAGKRKPCVQCKRVISGHCNRCECESVPVCVRMRSLVFFPSTKEEAIK